MQVILVDFRKVCELLTSIWANMFGSPFKTVRALISLSQVYYAEDQTWVQKAFLPTARFRTAAASAGGLAYVFGGADLCIDVDPKCPLLDRNEVFLDVDHPRVYIYLKNQAYNDSAPTTQYPL